MSITARFVTSLGFVATVVLAAPCDIYGSANTPCVAAHSTTRALYDSYNGALYQVIRGSDNRTADIGLLSQGGVANANAQDQFCSGTTCLINLLYDQSGRGNHLESHVTGYWPGPGPDGTDDLASAIGAPVTVKGSKAYGIFVSPGVGYRNSKTNGIPTGDEPEGIYAVLDATHYNDGCCFDYGNAEVSNTDTGDGRMETVYFGNNNGWGSGDGSGPWVMADLENGIFSGANRGYNSDPVISGRFVTAMVKGNSNNNWAIRSGNSQEGGLITSYNGVRPNGYNPMYKEGSVLLGIGGDNSNLGSGTFYEGVLTSGFPSDETESAVQADIVAANYQEASMVSGPEFTVGSTVTLRVTTPGYENRYLAHSGRDVNTQVISSSTDQGTRNAGSWIVRTGLGNSGCYSFESVDSPGSFIHHYGFQLFVDGNGNNKGFNEDATWCPQAGLAGQGSSIRSWSYPTRFFRHYGNVGYAASNGGVQNFDNTGSFNNDVTFVVGSGF